MRHRGNVLILTAGYGDGHMKVSETLREAFYRYGFRHVRLLDLYREAHPTIDTIAKFLYNKSLAASTYGFHYYGWSYYLTRNMEKDSPLGRWLNRLGNKMLANVIQQEKPAVVISTFPFGGIGELLKKSTTPIHAFTVVTDFALHNRWVFTASDHFYVATEDLKAALIRRNIPEDRITVSGIPVREPFCRTQTDDAGNGTDKERTVLIMGGAYGAKDIRNMTEYLRQIPNVRIDVVCGRNEKLREYLHNCFGHAPDVRLFGFVDTIHELMKRSSCIVTKAGGVTLSEAMQVQIPIVIFKPFPGQEKENARYLAGKGAAVVAGNARQVAAHVEQILTSDQIRRDMVDRYRSLHVGNAADIIVRDALRVVNLRKEKPGNSIA